MSGHAGDQRGRPRIHIARTLAEATRADPSTPEAPGHGEPAGAHVGEAGRAPDAGLVTLPVAEVASLRERAEERDRLAQERDRLLDQAQRARAELVNFRARTQKEREQWGAQGRRELVGCLVAVLVDFDRALKAEAVAAAESAVGSFLSGMRLVREQLWKALADHGMAPIEAAGLPFDPRVHEAVMQVPAPEGQASGTVVTVFEAGYTLDGQVVRPARVSVAAGPPAPEARPITTSGSAAPGGDSDSL